MMINDDTVKNLTASIDRLVEAIQQMDGGTQAKKIAGETTTMTKTVATSTEKTTTGAVGDIASMMNPYLAAGKQAWNSINQVYNASPLNQTGSPNLTDIYMQKYTRPREELQKISEDLAQSGRALTQSEVSSIMKGINQQVMASQQSLKVLRNATSAMPNFERYQQNSFELIAEKIENSFKSLDALAGSLETLSQMPEKLNQVFGSFFDRVLK